MAMHSLFDRERKARVRKALDAGDLSTLRAGKIAPDAALGAGGQSDVLSRYAQCRRLFHAVLDNDLDAAEDALKNGALADYRNDIHLTKITEGTESDEQIARLHIERRQGETMLMIAAKKANGPMMELLIRFGADVNARTNHGTAPFPAVLEFAATEGIREILIRNGATE